MKIKYKIAIIFILIILFSTIPISLYILQYEENEKISTLTSQAITNSKILSRSAVDILFINGGNLSSSRVDAGETISVLETLKENGLIYADAILASTKPGYNGVILAQLFGKEIKNHGMFTEDKIADKEIERLISGSGFKKIFIPELGDTFYEFASVSAIPGTTSSCIGRLVFSKSFILAPIQKLKTVIFLATVISILIAVVISAAFSRYISGPIEYLTKEVEIIGNGDFRHQIEVTRKDEIGRLSTTFNHLARVVRMEIEQLLTQNVELTMLDKLKDEFLANITHELRTPLQGIIGLSESLMEGIAGEINEGVKYNLLLMIKSGKRLTNLVNDILDYSQLKYDKIILNMAPINLYALFKLIQSITAPLIGEKKLKINIFINPDTFFVYADENRLQQILINIVGNAIKFTDSGTVDLSAMVSEYNKEEIIISVRDTGRGIPPDEHDKIFSSFEQGDRSASGRYGGTGFGLAITRQLVELHGGRIWFNSDEGRGTTFYFTIRRSAEAAIENTERAGSIPSQDKDREVFEPRQFAIDDSIRKHPFDEIFNIMIVDDEPVNCQVLMNHLILEGYNVKSFQSDSLALKKIMEEDDIPDLLILDLMLPRISGYEMCRIIREKYSSVELPILILTAKDRISDIIQGFESGTNDYLTKPVNREELIARVHSLLMLKKAVKESNELNAISREIEIARKIQYSLLTKDLPPLENLAFAVRYLPMSRVGGDYYEIRMIDQDKISVLVADVTGHGIPAAFISTMLKIACDIYSQETDDPAAYLKNINVLMSDYLSERFITACYAVIDLKNRKITQANAGHWPILIVRRDEGEVICEMKNNMPLGLSKDEEFFTIEFDLEADDRIFFYTDCIIESKNSKGKIFGDKNLHNYLCSVKDKDIEDIADGLIEELRIWSGISEDMSFSDDITLIIVDIKNFNF